MKKLLTTLTAAGLLSVTASVQSAPMMTSYMEGALISVCKSTLTNSPAKYRKTLKEYRLKQNTVAKKLMCNGEDVGSFAATHGAERVSDMIRRYQTHVNIIDLAASQTSPQQIHVAMR